MMTASPFLAQIATPQPDGRRGEGAGTHAAQGRTPPAPWPVEETEIGLQYVIPGYERRESARPARQYVEGGHG